MNQLDFNNRTAVVTGGAAGIGLAIVKRLVQSGARVAIWDRDARALDAARSSLGSEVFTQELEVTDAAAVGSAAKATADAFGRIDVLVCSAGISGPNVPTWEYPIDDWKRVFDVNVNGLFYCNRAGVPFMRER